VLALAALVVAPVRASRARLDRACARIAAVTASTNDGVVTLVVTGNYDHMNVVRLGYPVTIIVTAGGTVARLGSTAASRSRSAPIRRRRSRRARRRRDRLDRDGRRTAGAAGPALRRRLRRISRTLLRSNAAG
jgi:hypothetical protein